MPLIAKGGKYVFGWSLIGSGGRIQIPPETQAEYRLVPGGKVILTSGSKSTGGFTVSTKELLQRSALAGGLGNANGEILGGVWTLLVSLAALQAGELPKVLNQLGWKIGAFGIVTIIPVLNASTGTALPANVASRASTRKTEK
jgi:hypothetical protein